MNSQDLLAGVALLAMAIITGLLIFVPVPQPNQQLVTFALGAISGAMTVGGAAKLGSALKPPSPPEPPAP